MLPFKSTELERGQPDLLPTSPRVEAELALWEQLAFSFDMDNESSRPTSDERAHNPRRTRSNSQSLPGRSNTAIHPNAQGAAILAQFAAAAGMPSHGMAQPHPFGSLISPEGHPQSGFHESFFNHDHDIGQGSLPPPSSMDFPWNQFPSPQSNQNPYAMMQITMPNPGMSPFPTGYGNQPRAHSVTGPLPSAASTSRPSRRVSIHNPPVASSSTSPSGSPDPENMTEAERIASVEEKRRRNTAASARFRIKKKQRTTNLERSVSDLTGRAEDLEREAADLRRENGWLKEIVMLKGSRLAGVNLASHSEGHQSSASRRPDDKGSDSDEPSSGQEEEKGRAGKNKKKSSKKK